MAELSTLKSLHPILSQFSLNGSDTLRGIVGRLSGYSHIRSFVLS